MDWNRWQAELEAQIPHLRRDSLKPDRLLPPQDSNLIHQIEQIIERKLPSDFVEFYQRYGGLDLPDVWNSYRIRPLEELLQGMFRNGSWTPGQIQSPEYNGQILIFGADCGGQSFCIFFDDKSETQPILYLPDAYWNDDVCEYSIIAGKYIGPKWLAPDFSTFLERILEDTKAYVREDPDWEYMDHDLYDEKNL